MREVLVLPHRTELARSHEHRMGVANIRGQVIPVVDLPAVVGCHPSKGHTILMVAEWARTVQAFARAQTPQASAPEAAAVLRAATGLKTMAQSFGPT